MNKKLINIVMVIMVILLVVQVITIIEVSNLKSSFLEKSGEAGVVNLSGDTTAYITGYEWLQLNNESDNKIHLHNGQVRVTSPNFNWGGDTVATQTWVLENISPECLTGE